MAKNVYTEIVSETPQMAPLNERQVQNSAGGYSYPVGVWTRVERFLILGSEGGSYYATPRKLTLENMAAIKQAAQEDPVKLAEMIRGVSVSARALRPAPAQFALAYMASLGGEIASAAYDVLGDVLRTGRQFLEWNETVESMGGKWGAKRRRMVSSWYLDKSAEDLAFQVAKYRPSGMKHRDVLRLAHPSFTGAEMRNLADYMADHEYQEDLLPKPLRNFLQIRRLETDKEVAEFIRKNRVPWEFVPDSLLNSPEVWSALFPGLPVTALIRNLGRMTALGVIGNKEAESIESLLSSSSIMRKARVHPVWILLAQRAYDLGKSSSQREDALSWTPNKRITQAMDSAFHAAFGYQDKIDANVLVGVDVSGSMRSNCAPNLSCAEAAAALSLVFARLARSSKIMGFSGKFVDLGISSDDSLQVATKKVQRSDFGSTDCSLPMLHAMKENKRYDAFVVITDSETWAGRVHPSEALNQYRATMMPDAKLAVLGMVSNGFSIADPNDPNSIDLVGFDASIPQAISAFINL